MDKDERTISERYYVFQGINSNQKKEWLITSLFNCKEVRDTLYPLDNSDVKQLFIVEFHARKEKDMYVVNGSLLLEDKDRYEGRTFNAYISSSKGETRVYLDIVREGTENKVVTMTEEYQKTIVTNEKFVDAGDKILTVTSYSGIPGMVFEDEIPKRDRNNSLIEENCKKMGAF